MESKVREVDFSEFGIQVKTVDEVTDGKSTTRISLPTATPIVSETKDFSSFDRTVSVKQKEAVESMDPPAPVSSGRSKAKKYHGLTDSDMKTHTTDGVDVKKKAISMPEAWTKNAFLMAGFKFCKAQGLKTTWAWVEVSENAKFFEFKASWRRSCTWHFMSRPTEHQLRALQLAEIIIHIQSVVLSEQKEKIDETAFPPLPMKVVQDKKKKKESKAVDNDVKAPSTLMGNSVLNAAVMMTAVAKAAAAVKECDLDVTTVAMGDDVTVMLEPGEKKKKKAKRAKAWFRKGEAEPAWQAIKRGQEALVVKHFYKEHLQRKANDSADRWLLRLILWNESTIEIQSGVLAKEECLRLLTHMLFNYVVKRRTDSVEMGELGDPLTWIDIEEPFDPVGLKSDVFIGYYEDVIQPQREIEERDDAHPSPRKLSSPELKQSESESTDPHSAEDE